MRAHKQREEERIKNGKEREVYKRIEESGVILQTLHKSELSSLLGRLEEVSFPQVMVEVEGSVWGGRGSMSQDNIKLSFEASSILFELKQKNTSEVP